MEQDELPTLARRLKMYRESKTLSQYSLAKLVGIKHDTVSRHEKGQRTPGPDTIKKYASVLGIEPQDLFMDTNN